MNRRSRRINRREAIGLCAAGAGLAVGSSAKAQNSWVDEQMKRLSLADKIGQMLCTVSSEENLEDLIRSGKAGTFFIKSGLSVPEVAEFVNGYQKLAPLPLLTANGSSQPAMVVKGLVEFPTNMAMAAAGDKQLVGAVGKAIAEQARAIGLHWAGPTCSDVNTNPRNPIINTRTFGDRPDIVAEYAPVLIKALQEGGTIAWAYHFPGHGDTGEDSHMELPVLDLDWNRLRTVDLVPFRAAIKAGVKSICTAHISYPKIEPTKGLPATLSKRILTGLLREELGFTGLITSDSFAMDAIRRNFKIEEAAVMAIQAGVDLLLAYPGTAGMHGAILKAAEKSPEMRKRVEESARRILDLKAWLRLNQQALVRPGTRGPDTAQHRDLALKVARKAQTVIRDKDLIPGLRKGPVLFVVNQVRPRSSGEKPHEQLVEAFKQFFPSASYLVLAPEPTDEERRRLDEEVGKASSVVFCVLTKVRSHDPTSAFGPPAHVPIIQQASRSKPTAVVLYGAPYPLVQFRDARLLLCSWDDTPASIQAGAEVCAGRLRPIGRLPVRLEPGLNS